MFDAPSKVLGIIDVNVYAFVQVLSKEYDICTLDPAHFKCPSGPGPVRVDIKANIPSSAPAGSYELTFSGKDEKKQDIFCVVVDAKIGDAVDLDQEEMGAYVFECGLDSCL